MRESRLARLVLTVTVTGLPGETVPEDCDKVNELRRVGGTEADQDTGPPCAVMMKEPPSKGESTIVVGATVIVPVTGGDVVVGGLDDLPDDGAAVDGCPAVDWPGDGPVAGPGAGPGADADACT